MWLHASDPVLSKCKKVFPLHFVINFDIVKLDCWSKMENLGKTQTESQASALLTTNLFVLIIYFHSLIDTV